MTYLVSYLASRQGSLAAYFLLHPIRASSLLKRGEGENGEEDEARVCLLKRKKEEEEEVGPRKKEKDKKKKNLKSNDFKESKAKLTEERKISVRFVALTRKRHRLKKNI